MTPRVPPTPPTPPTPNPDLFCFKGGFCCPFASWKEPDWTACSVPTLSTGGYIMWQTGDLGRDTPAPSWCPLRTRPVVVTAEKVIEIAGLYGKK